MIPSYFTKTSREVPQKLLNFLTVLLKHIKYIQIIITNFTQKKSKVAEETKKPPTA